MDDIYNDLKVCMLFNNISKDEISTFLNKYNYTISNYNKNDIISLEDSECNRIAIILDGTVAVKKILASGRSVTITTLSKGNVFGEVIVFSDKNILPATITAISNSRIIFINKNEIVEFCSNNQTFLKNFMKLLSCKILTLNKKVYELSLHSIRQKIANYLLKEYTNQKSKTIILKTTKNKLAEELGIPRPSLSRELIKLKDEGIIQYNKNIIKILNIETLENFLLN